MSQRLRCACICTAFVCLAHRFAAQPYLTGRADMFRLFVQVPSAKRNVLVCSILTHYRFLVSLFYEKSSHVSRSGMCECQTNKSLPIQMQILPHWLSYNMKGQFGRTALYKSKRNISFAQTVLQQYNLDCTCSFACSHKNQQRSRCQKYHHYLVDNLPFKYQGVFRK